MAVFQYTQELAKGDFMANKGVVLVTMVMDL